MSGLPRLVGTRDRLSVAYGVQMGGAAYLSVEGVNAWEVANAVIAAAQDTYPGVVAQFTDGTGPRSTYCRVVFNVDPDALGINRGGAVHESKRRALRGLVGRAKEEIASQWARHDKGFV